MSERQPARRPGGRSARIGAAVHHAVTELVSEHGYGNLTVSEIASRAGVADTSIYRRWGDLESLLADVLLTRLNAQAPMPDTGSLVRDLHAYAATVAREINGPEGLAVLRLAVALSERGEAGLRARDDFLAERQRQLQAMLDRAAERDEDPPTADDLVDQLLAPMYIRVLLGGGPLGSAYVAGLVDRLVGHRPVSR